MHNTDEEKYLGDQINKYAKHGSTISKRRARGFGIISDIIQIIDSIPDGRRRVQIGLHLRQSWFINSLFVNIEVWHNVLKKDIDSLVDLDKYLMKKILNVHSKAPIELLYLETSAIPLNFILAGRSINYLHNILIKDSNELVRRVYIAQKQNPQKGDWCKLLQDDMKLLSFNMTTYSHTIRLEWSKKYDLILASWT